MTHLNHSTSDTEELESGKPPLLPFGNGNRMSKVYSFLFSFMGGGDNKRLS